MVVGIALIALLFGTAYVLLDFGLQYHLLRLRIDPAYLAELVSAPQGSSRSQAVEAHLRNPAGRQNLVRQYVHLVVTVLEDSMQTEPTALDLSRWQEVVIRMHPLNGRSDEREWWARYHSRGRDGSQGGGRARCLPALSGLYEILNNLPSFDESEVRLESHPSFKFRVFYGRTWNTRDGTMNYWSTPRSSTGSILCIAERSSVGLQ